MHGVTEFMNEHAKDFGLDSDEMYILRLLHDIGTHLGFDSVAYANCMETVKFLMKFDKIENCRK